MQARAETSRAIGLLRRVRSLRRSVASDAETIMQNWSPEIVRAAFLPSAENLASYLAFRRRDLRPLQSALVPWGLSSLGRSESRVLPTLDAVIATLSAISGASGPSATHPPTAAFRRGERRLEANTCELFGQ